MRKAIVAAVLAAAAAFGADLTGNWKGSGYRPDGSEAMPLLMILKQDADKVTGSVGYSVSEQAEISNARLEGDTLLFDVASDNGNYKVKLTVAGETMKGTAVRLRDGQESPPMKVEFGRAK